MSELIFDGKSFHIDWIETDKNLNQIIFENTKGKAQKLPSNDAVNNK
jgi:hypothetical protein